MEVNEKEAVAIVGESGCGKSTVALTIMGLNPSARITNGEIMLEGRNLLSLSPKQMQDIRGRLISMIFQNPTTFLDPVMKIKDQLMEILLRHYASMSREEAQSRIEETVAKVGLHTRVLENYPFELSGGMLQRIMIVMMLLPRPRVIIADEPTSALDTTIQVEVLDLLSSLQKTEGISILLITHDLGIVAELCDRIYVMYAGRFVESANVYTLYEKPMHPYTSGLLNSILSIDEYKESLPILPGDVPDLTQVPSGCAFHPRCSHVMDVCRKENPPSVEVDSQHMVSCWLYEER